MKTRICAILVCGFLILTSCATSDDNNQILLDEKASFFSDFSIDDGMVFFFCHLEVINQTTESQQVHIQGDFREDVKGGLIQSPYLIAYRKDDPDNTVFVLKPGKNVFDIFFLDEKGFADEKQNRLLPPLEFIPIP